MAYHYQTFDNVFDIESISNLYIDSHYFVAQHRIEIFYLCDVNHVHNFRQIDKYGNPIDKLIRQRILHHLPELRQDPQLQIKFYNLRNLVDLKQYFKLFGVTPNAPAALAYMNQAGQIFPPSRRDAGHFHGGNSLNIVHHAKPVDVFQYNHDLTARSNANSYRNVPGAYNVNFRYYPPKRTDPHFNPYEYGHGEMMGYNSANYDLTMVAHFLGALIQVPTIREALNQDWKRWPRSMSLTDYKALNQILSPDFMRRLNDELFNPENRENMKRTLIAHNDQPYFKRIETVPWYIYKGWKQTNRFLDISDLNRRVSLKRIEATMGMQIKESKKVLDPNQSPHLTNFNDVANLIAYNINDVYATRLTFELPVYQDALTLRNILLAKFPALIYSYDRRRVSRAKATPRDVKIAPDNLRFTRLNSDFSSAQFIINVIAPYHPMKDIPGINYSYPDQRVLQILKQKRPNDPNVPDRPVDVLDQTMLWARKQDRKYHTNGSIAKHFFHVYNVYKQLEFHNVNSDLCDQNTMVSCHFKLKDPDGIPRWVCPYVNLKRFMRPKNMNMPYIKANGKPSSCLVTFSIGGIHGLEIRQSRYVNEIKRWRKMKRIQRIMMKDYGADNTGASKIGPTFIIKNRGLIVSTSQYVKRGAHASWRHLDPPSLFKRAPRTGKYLLRKRYAYISVDPCQHEDFSGYYPMLISRLGLFWPHDQPTDMYRHLYIERLHLKHQLRKYTKNSKPWNKINLQQKLRKLLLNAASGAGAGGFTNNIRMNNAMVSMRIIGQLFAWRIGEAETLAGGRVPSTNTDGMYVMDVSQKTNNQVLFKNVKAMMLEIVPSPLARFVSKDANNRVEVERHGRRNVLTEAKGGTLRSWQGPSPSNHLSHPAVADWVLAHYLAYYPSNPSEHPFDESFAMNYLNKMHRALLNDDKFVQALKMFQWINISNLSKHRYLFLQRERWDSVTKKWRLIGINQLPRTNRLFMIKNEPKGINHFIKIATDQTVHSSANGPVRSDPYSKAVLANHGDALDSDNEYGKVIKVTDMPEHQNVYLNGKRLRFFTTAERRWLYRHLDVHAYLNFIKVKFNSSWRNK